MKDNLKGISFSSLLEGLPAIPWPPCPCALPLVFELGKVRTQALCPWKKKVSSNASTGMLNGDGRVPQFLEQRKSRLILV